MNIRTRFFPAPRIGALALASTLLYLTGTSAAWAQLGGFGGVRIEGVLVTRDRPLLTAPRPDALYRPAPTLRALSPPNRSATVLSRADAPLRVAALSNAPTVQAPSPNPPAPAPAGSSRADQTVFSDPTLFSNDRLCAPLHDPAIRNALNDKLREILVTQLQGHLPGGFGVHSQTNHRLGNECAARAEIVGNRITVRLQLPRNRFFARITTPDADTPFGSIGAPGEVDPNFYIHYDLDATATFLLPTSLDGRVVQESLQVGAVNVDRPQTRSVTGNLALAMNDIVHFLGGPDFVAQMRQDRYVSMGSLLSVDLGEWNRKLAQEIGTTPAQARIENGFRGDQLLMHLTRRAPEPGPIVH